MDITTTKQNEVTILALKGKMDLSNAGILKAEVKSR